MDHENPFAAPTTKSARDIPPIVVDHEPTKWYRPRNYWLLASVVWMILGPVVAFAIERANQFFKPPLTSNPVISVIWLVLAAVWIACAVMAVMEALRQKMLRKKRNDLVASIMILSCSLFSAGFLGYMLIMFGWDFEKW